MSSCMKTSSSDVQKNRLLWIDPSNQTKDDDSQNTLDQLNSIMDDIVLCQSVCDAVRLLKKWKLEKVFIMTSGAFGKTLLPKIHDMKQVGLIYIFCREPREYVSWASQWSKIRGVHSHIGPICKSLRTTLKKTIGDMTSMSFLSIDDDPNSEPRGLNRLEPSFMYTQVFKTILLEMTYDEQARQALRNIGRKDNIDNPNELQSIENFIENYRPNKAIWWYTRASFVFLRLNQALRNLETDVIVDMGFFIHDLHQQLEQLHHLQSQKYTDRYLTLYRGQEISDDDFAKMQKTQGGLISFNSFLSTSENREISLGFAQSAIKKNATKGILFVITIDLKNTARTPFANVESESFFEKEAEVLFSMHSVFRIGQIRNLDKSEKLFEVTLSSTSADDRELRKLTGQIEEEVSGSTGWQRLIKLLIKLGHLEKAETLCRSLLDQKPNKQDEAHYNYEMGRIKYDEGNFKAAIHLYEASLLIDPNLAAAYQGLGQVYDRIGEYSKALTYYDKALDINRQTLPFDHPAIGASYNNIAGVYKSREDYSNALVFYQKAFDIWDINLPANHPDFATLYNNLGAVYFSIQESDQALDHFKKARNIWEKVLPADHLDLSMSYNNIGIVYDEKEEYQQALSFHYKALVIRQKHGSGNHPLLGSTYNNLGMIHIKIKQYTEALSFLNQALNIWEKSLPENHPDLAIVCNNIAWVHRLVGNLSEALSYYQQALAIRQRAFDPNHSSVLDLRQSIAMVKKDDTEGEAE